MADATCSVDECVRPAYARGWCRLHYRRWHHDHWGESGRRIRPWQDRFWEAVDKRADGCWIWTHARDKDGYGRFSVEGQRTRAHRTSYEMHVGPIPDGLEIDHLCRVTSCVNPAHLEVVTGAENTRRRDIVHPRRRSLNVSETKWAAVVLIDVAVRDFLSSGALDQTEWTPADREMIEREAIHRLEGLTVRFPEKRDRLALDRNGLQAAWRQAKNPKP